MSLCLKMRVLHRLVGASSRNKAITLPRMKKIFSDWTADEERKSDLRKAAKGPLKPLCDAYMISSREW